ncbi:ABC transporter permease [Rhodococcus sp. 05-2255-3B1]|uniref:ABC transporter permease n=1 Tax=unclassified Rhodococcus (in: high G+C Gram-positive bacteria) TaxID=192944 RepID=UPI000B9C0240|nr:MULTISPECIES: ABC transporter permease [unclassified Rhodococcus (in: high G+C Gram-positive bacteria)]OZE03818.1 ABC transporter permease [Rhodococcus sp. 05-2255-3C]OZE12622.1 ABC transporter permease [Rhodococcus sp. 05-2255-3B1]OZE17090.1 ABC transporter permease [Rhodococcus sp. 05-2255-2A2]
MTTVRNEFAKLRHLHIGAIAALLVAAIVGLTFVGALTAATSNDSTAASWALPLAGLSLAIPIASPLLIAVMASRTVEVEHQSNGWLLNQTTGADRGALVRAKLVSTGLVVGGATVAASATGVFLGTAIGVTQPLPAGLWLGYTAAAVTVNIVILALHLLISARVDNQLVALGIGIVGTVIAICASGFPSWAAHLTPWGYYSSASAADYRGEQVVTLNPSYVSIVALGVVGAVLFWLMTVRLDRQEVRA